MWVEGIKFAKKYDAGVCLKYIVSQTGTLFRSKFCGMEFLHIWYSGAFPKLHKYTIHISQINKYTEFVICVKKFDFHGIDSPSIPAVTSTQITNAQIFERVHTLHNSPPFFVSKELLTAVHTHHTHQLQPPGSRQVECNCCLQLPKYPS